MKISLNPIFADGMVLQRDKEIHIWGKVAGEKTGENPLEISVVFDNAATVAEVRENKWFAKFPPHEAGIGYSLSVVCGDDRITISDIAVGDVWVAGGQSNMGFYLKYEKHVWKGNYPEFNELIRFYDVPKIAYKGQKAAFDYSDMEVWRKATSKEDLDYFSAVGYYFAEKLYREEQIPIGIVGCNWGGTAILGWMDPESVKRVGKPWWDEVEKQMSGVDMEEYFRAQNSNPLNDTGNPMKSPFDAYMLPEVRTDEEAAQFMGELMASENQAIATAGGLPMNGGLPTLEPKQLPGAMYEYMVKEISDFTIKGFLFYQGESDDATEFGPEIYDRMFEAMIDDWRKLWHEENLPFLAVQVAPFRHWMGIECQSFATIRKKQQLAAERTPEVYLASIGDVGMEMDIHPKDKKTVGERLALLALGHVYGRKLLCDAPVAVNGTRNGKTIQVEFRNAGEGLYVDESKRLPLNVFDSDNCEIPAAYKVMDDVLQLYLQTEGKRKVRIAFACTNWYEMNLFNSAGIPAFPFEMVL